MSDTIQAQIAATTAENSVTVMELAEESASFNKATNEVLTSFGTVLAAKERLEAMHDHELTAEDATAIDHQLGELNVVTVEEGDIVYNEHRVMGAENLGIDLRPRDFRLTRIAACEGFLNSALETVKVFSKRLVQNFHDAYTLAVEDTESLITRFKMIERANKDLGEFKDGLERFNLSSRLFNLLKVSSEVKEDWTTQIMNLHKTTSALTSNYYDYSDRELTAIMAFFSRFDDVTSDEEAVAILMTSGSILNTTPFRECKIDISDKQVPWLRKLRSVELMGGRYLIDTRWKDPLKIRDVRTIDDWFDSRVNDLGVRLNKRETIDYIDTEQEINTFGSKTINGICQLSIKILENWLTVCQRANKHRVSDRDYESIGNMLSNLPISSGDKHRIMAMYSMSVRKNQQDLVNLNADFTRYIVVTMNAIASLCNDSINYAKSV